DVTGAAVARLPEPARRIQAVMATVPGVRQPDVSVRTGRPELRAEVDRARAAASGVTPAEVVTALRDAVQGNTEVKYRQAEHTYDVRVSMAGLRAAGPEALGSLPVAPAAGAPV